MWDRTMDTIIIAIIGGSIGMKGVHQVIIAEKERIFT
jgi:hypothetical protein